MKDGSLFIAIFNISLDPIEEFPLVFDRNITSIETLTETGERMPIEWTVKDGIYRLNKTVYSLHPLILFAK